MQNFSSRGQLVSISIRNEHTHKHSTLYIRLAGVPGVAREVEENDVIKIIISI